MGQILWLASYPKSGNTWVRAFLSNLAPGASAPADINQLDAWNCSRRAFLDWYLGVETSSLSEAEIERSRTEAYRLFALDNQEIHPSKTFFRTGKAGCWREALTDEQCDRILADHGAVMRRFGYLTEAGEIVY